MQFNAANTYQQVTARSASPVGLIVLLYDNAIECFHCAVRAIDANDVERRVAELNRALVIVGVLQSALDHRRGGNVAPQLEQFYNLARAQMLQASIQCSTPILKSLIAQFVSVRDAWKQVEDSERKSSKEAPSTMLSGHVNAVPAATAAWSA